MAIADIVAAQLADLNTSTPGAPANSWLTQLKQASWRNVPFQVDTIDISAGDDTVLREYPFQDLPTVFSMGTAAEELKISGYVIGDDYLDQLDKLRNVLSGEGVLIHPTQGSIRCWVHGKYTVKEAPVTEGGMARIDMSFVRAEARRYPAGVGNTTDQVFSAANAAEASLIDNFAAGWDLEGLAGWANDNIVVTVKEVIDLLWDSVGVANKELSTFQSLYNQYITWPISELTTSGSLLGKAISQFMQLPETLTNGEAWQAFQSVRGFWPGASSKVAAAYSTSSNGYTPTDSGQQLASLLTLAPSPYMTPTRERQAQADAALGFLVEAETTVAAARAIAQVELESYDQAVALRTDFNTQFARVMRLASDMQARHITRGMTQHNALMSLQTAVLRDLQNRSRDLARLTTYTPQSWQPVIYISYRLFGTVAYAEEILRMNPHIQHPLLVPPGVPLRIIKH